MKYWYMRMKQGAGGHDFAKELWKKELVGVLWGTWRICHVQDENGQIDPDKVSYEHIQGACPQPTQFTRQWLVQPRTFLLQVESGDRVLTIFDNAVHIGTVGDGFLDDETPPDGEVFKCRPIHSRKTFPLDELPASFRLLSNTGRRAVQGIGACAPHAELLDKCDSPEQVRDKIAKMPASEFLEMLSPAQWEIVCSEYLRDSVGFRFLLLKPGKSLKAVDIVGVDGDFWRVLAQCKNDSSARDVSTVERWFKEASIGRGDILYYFCRGGIIGSVERCHLVDGSIIAIWLEANPDYFMAIRTL